MELLWLVGITLEGLKGIARGLRLAYSGKPGDRHPFWEKGFAYGFCRLRPILTMPPILSRVSPFRIILEDAASPSLLFIPGG